MRLSIMTRSIARSLCDSYLSHGNMGNGTIPGVGTCAYCASIYRQADLIRSKTNCDLRLAMRCTAEQRTLTTRICSQSSNDAAGITFQTTRAIIVPRRIIRSWYTDRWWVGCYIWYSEEGPGRAAAPPSPHLAIPNVTAHPSTASYGSELLYDGPLLCSFNVAIKGLSSKLSAESHSYSLIIISLVSNAHGEQAVVNSTGQISYRPITLKAYLSQENRTLYHQHTQ